MVTRTEPLLTGVLTPPLPAPQLSLSLVLSRPRPGLSCYDRAQSPFRLHSPLNHDVSTCSRLIGCLSLAASGVSSLSSHSPSGYILPLMTARHLSPQQSRSLLSSSSSSLSTLSQTVRSRHKTNTGTSRTDRHCDIQTI